MNELTPLIEASLRGALLIGILVLLRPPLRRFIGSPWLCSLWLVVLVRLLLPGSIQSSWSVFNWWPETKNAQIDRGPIEARVAVLPAKGIDSTTPLSTATNVAASPSKGQWLIVAWAVGVAATLSMLCLRILKTARMARSKRTAHHANLLQAFDSIPSEIRRNVTLQQVDDLDVPALVGLWRPQIWMPNSWLETMSVEELRHVLLHELGHARRGDLWVQWLFAVVQCVHWFNPAVWLAARVAQTDRELACDAWVLRRADLREPEQYGATLVKAAQLLRSRWHLPPAAITMAMSKGSLFSRVRSIGQFQPIAGWRAVLGSVGVGLFLSSLATDRLHAQSGGLAPGGAPVPVPAAPAAGAPAGAAPRAAGNAVLGGEGSANFGIEPPARPPVAEAANPSIATAGSGSLPSPYQVEVEARFFQTSESGWKALGLSGLSTGDPQGMLQLTSVLDFNGLHTLLARINAAGANNVASGSTSNTSPNLLGAAQSFLLAAPRVLTKSGQRAVIEIIREFRYATQFQPDATKPDGLLPTAFETRNVGITLEVEPTVAPDGFSVDLELIPQVVELTGFVRARDGQPIPIPVDPTKKGVDRILNTALPKDVVVQPIFSTRKITTSVTLFSGNTIVLGGLKQAEATNADEDPQVLFILITARILPKVTANATPGSSGLLLEPAPAAAGAMPAARGVGGPAILGGLAPQTPTPTPQVVPGQPSAAPPTALPPTPRAVPPPPAPSAGR